MEYTKGLIALRRSTDAFRLGNQDLVNSNVQLIKSRDIAGVDTVIAYSCQATNGDTYYVFINADTKRGGFGSTRTSGMGSFWSMPTKPV